MEDQKTYCPECGSEESGYFCRNCGALVSGEDRVLCPRCHHIVPAGQFCNQCGQGLAAISLNLRQLALAGDTFWVTSGTEPAAETGSDEVQLVPPDDSVELSQAELPEWLADLPAPPAAARPEPEARLYPKLNPIEPPAEPRNQRGFFVAVIVLLIVILVGLAVMAMLVLMRGGA